jgi:hypothetical protein
MVDLPDRLQEWASAGETVVVSDVLAEVGHDDEVANVSAQEENWLLQQLSLGVRWTRDLPLWPRVTGAVNASASSTRKSAIGGRDGVLFVSNDDDEVQLLYDSGVVVDASSLSGAGYSRCLARMNENIFATFVWDGSGHGGAYVFCTHDSSFPTAASDTVLGIFDADSEAYINPDTITACGDGVDDLWIFSNCSATSAKETCVQLHDDGSWPLNIVDTARTSPFPTASSTWEANGAVAYHDGTLVAVRLSNTGSSGVVAVSTDSGATWSAENTLVTGSTNWSPRWLAYSDEYGGWLVINQRGHVWLCTGDPAVGGNWIKQTAGSVGSAPTLLAQQLGAVWTCTSACVVGKTILLAGLLQGGDTAGLILESDDLFATVRRMLRGWTHVYHCGSRVGYWRDELLGASAPIDTCDFGLTYQGR